MKRWAEFPRNKRSLAEGPVKCARAAYRVNRMPFSALRFTGCLTLFLSFAANSGDSGCPAGTSSMTVSKFQCRSACRSCIQRPVTSDIGEGSDFGVISFAYGLQAGFFPAVARTSGV
jgi:hypothetical protein